MDINERKRAEAAIATITRQWRKTFDAMNDAVCLVDTEGKILRCNTAQLNLFKKSFSESIGRNLYENIVHGAPEYLPNYPFVRMRLSKQRETEVVPLYDRWFEIIVDPMLDTAGQLIGAVL
ncbi:MAG: PAS domain-containing protein [bacterium]|nr:PAS domain-containing protein [bacterium]